MLGSVLQSSIETLPLPLSACKHCGGFWKPQTTAVHFLSVILCSCQRVLLSAVPVFLWTAQPRTSSPGKSSRQSFPSFPLPGCCKLGSKLSISILQTCFQQPWQNIFMPVKPRGLGCVCLSGQPMLSLLKQPSNLLWNPKAGFSVTRDSKKYHAFPILIKAERVSFLVSDSPKHVQVFLLELANFQAELPIKISINFNKFSLALELWKQSQAASFPGSPFQKGSKFMFPGTTIPRRQFIVPQTRN